eukprot:815511-Amphidinium_carterae.1
MKARVKSVWTAGVVRLENEVLEGVHNAGQLRKFAEVKADNVHLTADAVQFSQPSSMGSEAVVELARDRLVG